MLKYVIFFVSIVQFPSLAVASLSLDEERENFTSGKFLPKNLARPGKDKDKTFNHQQNTLILLPDAKVILEDHYYKIQTYMLLANLGCPVLPSAILIDKHALKEENLEILRKHLGGTYCSLRYQYKVPCLKPIRGGNKVALQKEELEKHWNDELLLWPVAHADRIKNHYGINILFRPSSKKIMYEIVGQGFDGTDLNKGDLSPHQTIQLNLPFDRGYYGNLWYQAAVSVTSQENYNKSIQLRVEKLKKLNISSSEIIIPEVFSPFPLYQLEKLDRYACKVFQHFNYNQELNISSTILEDGRIVFWDFQTPENKSVAFVGK